MILNDLKLHETESRLDELESEIEDFSKLHTEKRTQIASTQGEIRNLKERIEQHEIALQGYKDELVEIADEHNTRQREATELSHLIEQHSRSCAIRDEIESKPSFYEMLDIKVKAIHESLTQELAGFVDLLDPASIVNNARNLIEGRTFGYDQVHWTTAKSNYEAHLKQLAENKVDKKNISLAQAKAHIDQLESFLRSNETQKYWTVK